MCFISKKKYPNKASKVKTLKKVISIENCKFEKQSLAYWYTFRRLGPPYIHFCNDVEGETEEYYSTFIAELLERTFPI